MPLFVLQDKIHVEMTEKSQVKYPVFIFTAGPIYIYIYDTVFHILCLNMDILKLQIIQNGG